MNTFKIFARLSSIVAAGLIAHSVGAATFTVSIDNDSGPGSLRQAIDDANALPGEDVVEFTITGTIGLTSGQLTISDDLIVSGPGSDVQTVSGSQLSAVFQIGSNATVAISGLTISNGSDGSIFAGPYEVEDCNEESETLAAGISNHGILTLTNVTVSDNKICTERISDSTIIGIAAGIGNYGTLEIYDSVVTNNISLGYFGRSDGSGIFNAGTLDLHRSTIANGFSESGSSLLNVDGATTVLHGSEISNNSSWYGSAGLENKGLTTLTDSLVRNNFCIDCVSGLRNSGTLTLTKSSVQDNWSTDSTAGIVNTGAMQIQHSIVSQNSGSTTGGIRTSDEILIEYSTIAENFAFEGVGGIWSTGAIIILESTMKSNEGSYSGGLASSDTATIVNSTVSGNTGSDGGGLWNEGTLTVINSTITENDAKNGGGIFNTGAVGPRPAGVTFLGNSIVAENIDSRNSNGMSPDVDGEFNSLGYNFIGIVDGGSGFGATGDQTGTLASPLDPLLGSLQDNGGPTETHALLPDSPAIDAGSNSLVEPGTITDQRGYLRIVNGTVDIGAVEYGDEGSYGFVEEDGLLSFEAEHYKTSVAAGGARKWLRRDPAVPDASNGQAIEAARGAATFTPGLGSYTTYVTVLNEGLYHVWVRFRAIHAGADSFFFQFNNESIDYVDLDPEDSQWRWQKLATPVSVDEFGVYTMVNFRRERLTELDKFVLTTDPDLDPAFINGGLGPAESKWLVPCDPAPDFDNDLIPDCSDPDDDNDGINDWYEIENMLDPFDPTDALLDPDNDGLTNLDEFLKNDGLDPNDPDTDGDGIGDALDTERSFPKNECTGGNGVNATLERVINRELTCAARTRIDVNPPTEVQDPDGYLHLFAPLIVLRDGFQSGRLQIISKDPCPGCSIGTALEWDQDNWDEADWQ